MTCKSRIALLASLAVWSSCILASATAQDNAASAPREQGAPDSNFVDLAKHGSNKLRQAMSCPMVCVKPVRRFAIDQTLTKSVSEMRLPTQSTSRPESV